MDAETDSCPSPAKSLAERVPLTRTRFLTEAAAWANLHRHYYRDELEEHIEEELCRILGSSPFALLLQEGPDAEYTVASASGGCPLRRGSKVTDKAWERETAPTIPLLFENHELGQLQLEAYPDEETLEVLQGFLLQASAAIVGLRLNAETRQSSENYCASIQALQEGVGLLQESDREIIEARFLDLCMTALKAQAGAVFLKDDADHTQESILCTSVMGAPEELFRGLVCPDQTWYPGTVKQTRPVRRCRDTDTGRIEGLDESNVPEVLQDLTVCPLDYRGLHVGCLILLNAQIVEYLIPSKLESIQRLCELGALLYDRIRRDEAEDLDRKEAIGREIGIRLQNRLLPAEAPSSDNYEIAYKIHHGRELGGDYLDVIQDEDGSLVLVIADVHGQDVNALLLMHSFRALLRGSATGRSTDELLATVEQQLRANHELDSGNCISTILARLRPGEGVLEQSNAGHVCAGLYRAREGRILLLEGGEAPLGTGCSGNYSCHTHEFQPGDFLFLLSDSYFEGMEESSGTERSLEEILAALPSIDDLAPVAILDALLGNALERRQEGANADDLSGIVVKARGN